MNVANHDPQQNTSIEGQACLNARYKRRFWISAAVSMPLTVPNFIWGAFTGEYLFQIPEPYVKPAGIIAVVGTSVYLHSLHKLNSLAEPRAARQFKEAHVREIAPTGQVNDMSLDEAIKIRGITKLQE